MGQSKLEGYTYKGEPLNYLGRHDLSKPYNEARRKIEVIPWYKVTCGGTFPRDAYKTLGGEIGSPHPQEGYTTQYAFYEIRDWTGTKYHKNFAGERIMRATDGSLFNRGFIMVPNIATEENPKVLDPFIYDNEKDEKYGPCIDPGALYLYFHTDEEDDVHTIAQVYMYDALYNRSSDVKYLSNDVDESVLYGNELPVFIQFGTPSHLMRLVEDFLYQKFPNEYKGAEGQVPKETLFDTGYVASDEIAENIEDQ